MSDQDISMTWPQYLRRECMIDGELAKLSKHQMTIFSTLLLRRGNPVFLDELIEILWPDPDNSVEWERNTVCVMISRLRQFKNLHSIVSCGRGSWMLPKPGQDVSCHPQGNIGKKYRKRFKVAGIVEAVC
jgi:hypothetical protein